MLVLESINIIIITKFEKTIAIGQAQFNILRKLIVENFEENCGYVSIYL